MLQNEISALIDHVGWIPGRDGKANRGQDQEDCGIFPVIPASADWPQGEGKDSLATIAQTPFRCS